MSDARHPDVDLAHLAVELLPLVLAVIEALKKLGHHPRVVETHRSEERQALLYATGRSHKVVSPHQANTPDGAPAARAIDLCDAVHGYDSPAFFDDLAREAEAVGLQSGHRWKWRDSAHVQLHP